MAFDIDRATAAHMSALSEKELELARAYTTGNHWLILAGLLVSALVTLVIVRTRILDRSIGRIPDKRVNFRVFVASFVFIVTNAILALPFTLYAEWWRETAFERSNQPLIDYLAQNGIGIALSGLFGALFLIGLYWLIRSAGRSWWLWAGGLLASATALVLLLSPVLIEPLFNTYEPIPEGEVREAVLVMAKEADIPPSRIFVYDGSRQSNNFTANVSGVGGSARIAISDVALDEAELDEVRAVTAHEIGHYVLGHVWILIATNSLITVAIFFLVDRTYSFFARLFGTNVEITDVRGLPVLFFAFSLFFTLATPLQNAISRMIERDADSYSLNMVGLPDALSAALVKTAEYRYPYAGPVEEALFYSHPTVHNRVRNAMEWKAANMSGNPAE